MSNQNTDSPAAPAPHRRHWPVWAYVAAIAVTALVTFIVVALLMNISQRRQEQQTRFVLLQAVDELTTDPAVWGRNWPREYGAYLQTVDVTNTRYGGSSAMPEQKLDQDPWLRRLFAGYAFSIDYRERRGHAYMLSDQQRTERVLQKPQAGACLHCHASVVPTWRRVGLQAMNQPADEKVLAADFNWPAVLKGFELMSTMPYTQAHAELLKTPDGSPGEAAPAAGGASAAVPTPAQTSPSAPTTQQVLAANVGEAHPVSCIDCHDPQTMQLRVSRPGFVRGIQALANAKETAPDGQERWVPVPHLKSVERWRSGPRSREYDPNEDATRQEMRSFVCGQCHVEYYCASREVLFFPWARGLRAEQIEQQYDEHKFPDGTPFHDFKHGETGALVYKAQHPEFEMWSQGIHARSGVACADCHMPYMREGATKVSDHWVRSPLLMVNRSCQTCHSFPEEELVARVATIQDRTRGLIDHAAAAMTDMLDAIRAAQAAGAPAERIAELHKLQRSAQWRLDFVSSENSMGFHADQETARLLAESIDYSRQAQAKAVALRAPAPPAATQPAEPVLGVTPAGEAPPAPYQTQPERRP